MKIIEIKKKELDNFIGKQKYAQFLQSWVWGEFQQESGSKVYRFGLEENGKVVFAWQFFKKSLPMGMSYFYAPRIDIKFNSNEQIKFVFKEVKKIAKREKVIFLRFEPRTELRVMGYEFRVKKTIDVQPSKTIIIDLGKTEEELLKAMHHKTRYNIRLAERKGVIVNKVELDRFDDFWNLMEETVARDGFRLHDKKHYLDMLSQNKGLIDLYFAELENKVLAANIITEFGDMVTYVHGSSSNQNRNLMAPYLLQWEVMKEVKQAGYKYYDFYGIDEDKWPGVTRFKKGFGGEEVVYPGTFDLVFSPFKYKVYKVLRAVRRLLA